MLEEKRGLEAWACPGGVFQGRNICQACEAPRSTLEAMGMGAGAYMRGTTASVQNQ